MVHAHTCFAFIVLKILQAFTAYCIKILVAEGQGDNDFGPKDIQIFDDLKTIVAFY